jgi:hypothetical protein
VLSLAWFHASDALQALSPRQRPSFWPSLRHQGQTRLGFAPFPVELVDISAVTSSASSTVLAESLASSATAVPSSVVGMQAIGDSLFEAAALPIVMSEGDHGVLLGQATTLLTSFSDQKGTLAGTFFQASLLPYLAFLYFLGFEGNRTPKLSQFGACSLSRRVCCCGGGGRSFCVVCVCVLRVTSESPQEPPHQ